MGTHYTTLLPCRYLMPTSMPNHKTMILILADGGWRTGAPLAQVLLMVPQIGGHPFNLAYDDTSAACSCCSFFDPLDASARPAPPPRPVHGSPLPSHRPTITRAACTNTSTVHHEFPSFRRASENPRADAPLCIRKRTELVRYSYSSYCLLYGTMREAPDA